MKLGEAQVEALLAFVCDEVAKVSDLDPTWFKEYVGAMLAHDEPLGELEEMTRADLKDFLEDKTDDFVALLFKEIRKAVQSSRSSSSSRSSRPPAVTVVPVVVAVAAPPAPTAEKHSIDPPAVEQQQNKRQKQSDEVAAPPEQQQQQQQQPPVQEQQPSQEDEHHDEEEDEDDEDRSWKHERRAKEEDDEKDTAAEDQYKPTALGSLSQSAPYQPGGYQQRPYNNARGNWRQQQQYRGGLLPIPGTQYPPMQLPLPGQMHHPQMYVPYHQPGMIQVAQPPQPPFQSSLAVPLLSSSSSSVGVLPPLEPPMNKRPRTDGPGGIQVYTSSSANSWDQYPPQQQQIDYSDQQQQQQQQYGFNARPQFGHGRPPRHSRPMPVPVISIPGGDPYQSPPRLQQQQQPPAPASDVASADATEDVPSQTAASAQEKTLPPKPPIVKTSWIEVSKIPPENLNIDNLNEHFKQFGNILEIQLKAPSNSAWIQYSTPLMAKNAVYSPEVIFNNRLVKVWYKKDTPDPAAAASDKPKPKPVPSRPPIPSGIIKTTKRSVQLVVNNAAPVAAAPAAAATAGPPLTLLQQKKLQVEIQQKAVLVEKRVEQQKKLQDMVEKNTGMTEQMRDEVLATVKQLSEQIATAQAEIDASKAILSALPQAAAAAPVGRGRGRPPRPGPAPTPAAASSAAAGFAARPHAAAAARPPVRPQGRVVMKIDNRPARIMVSQIPAELATEEHVRKHFSAFGALESVSMGGHGVAVVHFANRQEAQQAFNKGKNLGKSVLKMSWLMAGAGTVRGAAAGTNSSQQAEGSEPQPVAGSESETAEQPAESGGQFEDEQPPHEEQQDEVDTSDAA